MASQPEGKQEGREYRERRASQLMEELEDEFLEVEEHYERVGIFSRENSILLSVVRVDLLSEEPETLRDDHLVEKIQWLEKHLAQLCEKHKEMRSLADKLEAEYDDFMVLAEASGSICRKWNHYNNQPPVTINGVVQARGSAPVDRSNNVDFGWHARLRPRRGNTNRGSSDSSSSSSSSGEKR